MSQRAIRQRIREISSQITDLSRELETLLRIEENNNVQTDRAPSNTREPQVGDLAEITNSYIGRFGATRGSRGRITSIHRNAIYLRLNSNGAVVSRSIRNVTIVERQRQDDGNAQ